MFNFFFIAITYTKSVHCVLENVQITQERDKTITIQKKELVTSNQWNKKCFTQIIRIFRFSKFLLILYLYYYFWLHNKLFDFTFIQSIYLIKELKIHTFCGRWERSFTYIFRSCVSSIQYELWAILPEKLIWVKGVSKSFWMKKCADVSH